MINKLDVLNSKKIIFFADSHIFADLTSEAGKLTYDMTNDVLESISRESDVYQIIFLGDAINDSREIDIAYRNFDHLINKHIKNTKCYGIPGNHDSIEEIKNLSGLIASPPLIVNELDNNWIQLLVCSKKRESVGGLLSDNVYNLVKQNLDKYKDRYVLIALHHPLYKTNCDWLDCEFDGKENFLDLLNKYDNIKFIINGHIHQYKNFILDSKNFISCISSSYQFKEFSNVFMLDNQQPGYLEVILHLDGTYDVNVKRVNSNYDYSHIDFYP